MKGNRAKKPRKATTDFWSMSTKEQMRVLSAPETPPPMPSVEEQIRLLSKMTKAEERAIERELEKMDEDRRLKHRERVADKELALRRLNAAGPAPVGPAVVDLKAAALRYDVSPFTMEEYAEAGEFPKPYVPHRGRRGAKYVVGVLDAYMLTTHQLKPVQT